MSIRNGLRTYLLTISEVDALSDQKVYVGRTPQGKSLPHVVVDRISDDHNNALDGTGSLVMAEMEIDCKAATPTAADDLADAIKTAIDDYSGSMGDETCKAVIFNGFSHRDEYVDDKSDQQRYVTTLHVEIQYT